MGNLLSHLPLNEFKRRDLYVFFIPLGSKHLRIDFEENESLEIQIDNQKINGYLCLYTDYSCYGCHICAFVHVKTRQLVLFFWFPRYNRTDHAACLISQMLWMLFPELPFVCCGYRSYLGNNIRFSFHYDWRGFICIPGRGDTNFKRRFEADPRSKGFATHVQKRLNSSRIWWLGRVFPLPTELILLIESWLESEPYYLRISMQELEAAGYYDERHVENLYYA